MQQFFDVGLGASARSRPGVHVALLILICLWPVDVVSLAEQPSDYDATHQSAMDALFNEQFMKREQPPRAGSRDAMASLLLKNLRFRELQRRLDETDAGTGDDVGDEPPFLHRYHHYASDQYERLLSAPAVAKRLTADDLVRALNGKKAKDEQSSTGERLPTLRFAMKKRQAVSVSELAQMLENKMKARNTDDNVKLQSLRFGRR